MRHSRSVLLATLLSLPVITQAAEPAQCATVNFSDVGWTDITVTTAVASTLLDALGYKTKTTMISVPVTYKSLADGKNMDVFLGNWMPTSSLTVTLAPSTPCAPIWRTPNTPSPCPKPSITRV